MSQVLETTFERRSIRARRNPCRSLDAAIRGLESALGGNGRPPRAHVLAAARALAREFRAHMRVTESAHGPLDEMTALRGFSESVRALRNSHRDLCARIDALSDVVAESGVVSEWLRSEAVALAHLIRRHLAAEADLELALLNTDVGIGD